MADEMLDPNDPDALALCPPDKVIDAKAWFQTGLHEDKWSEFDDRGVPTKNIKKKKPTKKEKDALETEYLDASKAYQKYLKDVENWEQSKLDAEKALKKSDRLRWSFRQVGEKHAPMDPDDMETIIKLMGWAALSPKEFKVVKKGLGEIANSDGKVELEALRLYVRDTMAIQLMEELLKSEQLDAVELEELYSPRTWRGKIQEDPPPKKGGRKTSPRGSATSPRASKKATGEKGGSARGSTKAKASATSQSPRAKSQKKSQKA